MRLDVKGPPYTLLPSSATLTDEGWLLVGRPRRLPKNRPERRRRHINGI